MRFDSQLAAYLGPAATKDRNPIQTAEAAPDISARVPPESDGRPRRSAATLRHRVVLAAVAALLVALLPAGASALGTDHHSHRIAFTLTDARVTSGPRTGTSAGVLSGRPFGSGAVVQHVTVASLAGSVVKTKVAFTIYTATGSIVGHGRGQRTTNPDGTITTVGTRTITGGTGVYRGAHGQVNVRGTSATNGITITRWTGNVRY